MITVEMKKVKEEEEINSYWEEISLIQQSLEECLLEITSDIQKEMYIKTIKSLEAAGRALEREIPKVPLQHGHVEYDCPNDCGNFFYKGSIPNYCDNCGQRLDNSINEES